MGRFSTQFGALLHKNWLLRKRAWKSTVIELFLPVILLSLLIILKEKIGTESVANELHLDSGANFERTQFRANFGNYMMGLPLKGSILAKDPFDKGTCLDVNMTGLPQTELCFAPQQASQLAVVLPKSHDTSEQRAELTQFLAHAFRSDYEFSEALVPVCESLAKSKLVPSDIGSELGRYCDSVVIPTAVPTNLSSSFVRFFDSEPALKDYVTSASYGLSSQVSCVAPATSADQCNVRLAAAIVFTEMASGKDGNEWAYKIRVNNTAPFHDTQSGFYPWEPNTFTPAFDAIQVSYKASDWQEYLGVRITKLCQDNRKCRDRSFQGEAALAGIGFTTIQDAVDEWIRVDKLGVPADDSAFSWRAQPFPVSAHINDRFAQIMSGLLGLFMTLVYMWPVTRIIKTIVSEKELKIKEGMKMMGLMDSALFCSHFVTFLIQNFITALLIILIDSWTLYHYSNKFIIFLFFFLFGLSVFSFCYLVSSLFTRTRVASTVGAVFFLALFFGFFAVQKEEISYGQKAAASLSAPIAFGLGAGSIADYESTATGVSWANLWTEYHNYSVGTSLLYMFFDFVLYLLLGLYFDKVLPGTYGVPLKWYFFLQPSYWLDTKNKKAKKDKNDLKKSLLSDQSGHGGQDPIPAMQGRRADAFESVPCEGDVGVSVRHLRKVFPTQPSETVAVKNLNIDLYEGEIFALLGHNGAGKSTTINMLTGMYPPTTGDALVRDMAISEDMKYVRRELGVCPQHDVLFPTLSVQEHLELYAHIKGVPASDVARAVSDMIAQVGLTEKVHTQSAALSGGMKRKLSVGIAFLGDSKVIFLDEPTSGMDPYSRRSTWDLIKRNKKGRTIVLTTHFMDEADQLGDRIAIMARGEVRCCGSSLFLKNLFGVGYTMTMSKRKETSVDAIRAVVTQHVPDASILSSIAGEISFRLPFSASANFPQLFDEVDSIKSQLGVLSYGVSVTTLEEVFLRVARDEEDTDEALVTRKMSRRLSETRASFDQINDSSDSGVGGRPRQDSYAVNAEEFTTVIDSQSTPPTYGQESLLPKHQQSLSPPSSAVYIFCRHFYALFAKRFHNAKRDKKVWMWQVLYPFLILLLGVGLIKLGVNIKIPEVQLTPTLWHQTSNPISFNAPHGTSPMHAIDSFHIEPSPVDNLVAWQNMSEYLLASKLDRKFAANQPFKSEWTRFGAFFFGTNETHDDVTVFFNTTARDSLPVFLNLASNIKARQYDKTAHISTTAQPLPSTKGQETLFTSSLAIIISIGFAFIPASYVAYVVKERETNAKHQQVISGVSTLAYWSSSFAWDILNYITPAALAIGILYLYNISELIGPNLPATVVVVIMYGLSVTSFSYMFSFFFNNPSTAQTTTLMLYILLGAVLYIVSTVLTIIGGSTASVNNSLKYIYRLFPSYAFSECLGSLIVRTSVVVFHEVESPFAWLIIGRSCVYMAAECLVYFGAVLLMEKIKSTPELLRRFTKKIEIDEHANQNSGDDAHKHDEIDADVEKEANRVLSGRSAAENDMIQLEGLRKIYPGRAGQPPKLAVRNLSFGIPEGECFGFLGINGAGKTTTLKMLTADIIPSGGTARLAGLDILKEQKAVRHLIGYCPQFDALIPTLTAEEQLAMYARIKGVPESQVTRVVDRMITKLSLGPYAKKPCGGYSGGNKRKLSVGIALIGDPKIVFLDEPSTGMDPGSRRFMWDLIANSMQGRSVILTTHSMEECEALCGRIGIMVSGRLRCVGSAQHLKQTHGDGYQLDVNVACLEPNSEQQVVSDFTAFAQKTFEGARLIEQHSTSLKFRLSREDSLAHIFRVIEANKQRLNIKEYSVSETTLEQIFIHFAKQQDEETGAVAGF